MLELLGTVFGSIFSGGATGLIGVIAHRFSEYKSKQLDLQLAAQNQQFELQKRQVDAQIAAQEWAGRERVATVEGETAQEVAASQAFAQTLLKEPERYSNASTLSVGQQWLMVLLDLLRGAVRPLLTVYLCALTTMVYMQARMLLGREDLNVVQALELERLIVSTILYLTTTVVLWWFGTRNSQSAPKIG